MMSLCLCPYRDQCFFQINTSAITFFKHYEPIFIAVSAYLVEVGRGGVSGVVKKINSCARKSFATYCVFEEVTEGCVVMVFQCKQRRLFSTLFSIASAAISVLHMLN